MSNNNSNDDDDTNITMRKVFVGGLAWETPKEKLREQFEKYGEIVEAVIIYDKVTARSKGYGFVTFKEQEAAKKACEEPTLIINGRRANCNLASLGARQRRPTPPNFNSPNNKYLSLPLPHTQRGGRSNTYGNTNNNKKLQYWYYAAAVTPPSPFHHQAIPNFYGYMPTYIAPAVDHMNYNYNNHYYSQKVMSYGSYVNGEQQQVVYPSHQQEQATIVGPMIPPVAGVYPSPLYHYRNTTETMGVPVSVVSASPHHHHHIFHHPTIPLHLAQSITPTGPVGTGECFKRVV